ncbi:putative Xaa-Pro aminopeptidase [Tolypocladium ophioglossoides CBS 100239]|uniref:Xaa-Pro aminopeptidase n=1 Tax=Tolypocladium ophioglossoides (strain CBS 100239) TaxID=1163406 RepID=A0A0L0NBQ6_TOLOC|nr:putative Xaa-Pro aminopeptidase [Tolypocladium ophioglossoides CBS 100239]
MELDYDLILEEDFDALCLDVKGGSGAWSMGSSTPVRYPAKLHARRVAAELAVDGGLVYLPGQPEKDLEDSDQPQLFRQRRYFFYLAGANFPDCHITYEIAADRLVLWIPYVEPRQLLWFGSKPSAARCAQLYDVDEVRYASQLPKFLRGRASTTTTMYVLHADQAPDLDGLGSSGSGSSRGGMRINHALLRPAMDRARVVKTDYEVAMIRRANAVSSAAHRTIAEHLLKAPSERDIEAMFQAVCTSRGARAQAYPIIAGAGSNASTLHYGANDQPLAGKQLIVLDAGCEWDCYASDITRTLPIAGAFSPRAAAVHAIVQRMQDECIAGVRPGAVFYELHLHAAAVALDGLLRLGILKGDRDEIARAGTVAAFFPHGLGHHVGLEVHDVAGGLPLIAAAAGASAPGLRLEEGKREMISPQALVAMGNKSLSAQDRERQRLRPNMIVTVEPGIYFCREYLEGYFLSDAAHARFLDADVLEGYYPVGGVRIEDCILVTPDGNENLTTAPKGDELLDVINRGRQGRKRV